MHSWFPLYSMSCLEHNKQLSLFNIYNPCTQKQTDQFIKTFPSAGPGDQHCLGRGLGSLSVFLTLCCGLDLFHAPLGQEF